MKILPCSATFDLSTPEGFAQAGILVEIRGSENRLKRVGNSKSCIMYKFIVSLMSAFVFCGYANAQRQTTEIGKLIDDKPVLTIDKDRIIKNFSANLFKLSNINAQFNDVVLSKVSDNDYALVFRGNSHKSSLAVFVENGKMSAVVTTSCTTTDCSQERLGCIVKYEFPGDEIGACSPCGNGGNCTKTNSSKSLLELIY